MRAAEVPFGVFEEEEGGTWRHTQTYDVIGTTENWIYISENAPPLAENEDSACHCVKGHTLLAAQSDTIRDIGKWHQQLNWPCADSCALTTAPRSRLVTSILRINDIRRRRQIESGIYLFIRFWPLLCCILNMQKKKYRTRIDLPFSSCLDAACNSAAHNSSELKWLYSFLAKNTNAAYEMNKYESFEWGFVCQCARVSHTIVIKRLLIGIFGIAAR